MPGTLFAARDFIETGEGLLFAVVASGVEEGRVLAALRYVRTGQRFRKLGTEAAHCLIHEQYPGYVFRSRYRDTVLHGIPLARIRRHLLPQARVRKLLSDAPRDRRDHAARQFLDRMVDHGVAADSLGVTGSLLVGAQHKHSDIDIVISARRPFEAAREAIRRLIQCGEFSPLSESLWRTAYARRGCSLSYAQYRRHENRKFNKLCIDGIKIDVSLALRDAAGRGERFRKLGRVQSTAVVVDASRAFDYPAVWQVRSAVAPRVVSWTPTYTGQAFAGETILVRGWLEESERGTRQLVVGSSREAPGELIAVQPSARRQAAARPS